MNKVKCFTLLLTLASCVSMYGALDLDTIESLTGIMDFKEDTFEGKPAAENDSRIAKAWDFGMQRVNTYMHTFFKETDLPKLTDRVQKLAKETFGFQIYEALIKIASERFTDYKDLLIPKSKLVDKYNKIKAQAMALRKDIDKKVGFKGKVKLLFSSKITKAIHKDDQEARAFLLTLVDRLVKALDRIKEIIESPANQQDKETLRRLGY